VVLQAVVLQAVVLQTAVLPGGVLRRAVLRRAVLLVTEAPPRLACRLADGGPGSRVLAAATPS
jgi:hypothetical protein